MRHFKGDFLKNLRATDSGYPHYWPRRYEMTDASFERCTFQDCHLQSVRSPEEHHVIRSVTLDHCTVTNSSILTAALEDITVDRLKIAGGGRINNFTIEGCVFRHVVLKGPITGRLQINRGPDTSKSLLARNDVSYEQRWRDFYQRYYAQVDWALDISQAEFSNGPWMNAIPGHLVRRDPETQVLVRRDRIKSVDLRSIPWKGPAQIALQVFLERGQFDSIVVEAPKRSRNFKTDLEDIKLLRALNLAEPD